MARTLEQVKAGLKQAKKTKADAALAKLMLKFGTMTDEARRYIESVYPDLTLRITVLPNKTFRGVTHFVETDYDASTNLAHYAVEQGVAKWGTEK